MLNITSAHVETWQPDFSSSGQRDPTWLRVRTSQGELTNALGAVVWHENPVQAVLCEDCGYAGCAIGGWVHVARLGDHVLWSAPQATSEHGEELVPHKMAGRYGGLAMARIQWDQWRRRSRSVPPLDQLPFITGHGLAGVWRGSLLGATRASTLEELVFLLRQKLVSSDTLSPDEAIAAVEQAMAPLLAAGDSAIRGSLVAPGAIGTTVETLTLERTRLTEWPALALEDGEPRLAFGPELVLILD